MPPSVCRQNYHNKAFQAFGVLWVMLGVHKSVALDFQVTWNAPTDSNSQSYGQWAEARRFQIGDSLVFNYAADQDSVLQVTQDDYNNCNTDASQKFSDGHTVFKFDKSGPHYFISGNKDHCLKNEKLVVIVLADRNQRSSNTSTLAPPPSNSTGTTPSPSPSGEQPPSPPSGTVEITPTPAPTSEPPPPNGASSSMISSLSIKGAFVASSSLLLAF